MDLCLERKIIDDSQHLAMWSENVLGWLGKEFGNQLRDRLSNPKTDSQQVG